MRVLGWWEEYDFCGCVSEVVPHKRDLLGYCGRHGGDRRGAAHREVDWSEEREEDEIERTVRSETE